MSGANWLQLVALVGGIFLVTRLLGPYLARVLDGGPAPGDRVFLPVERAIYRVTGVDPKREQPWTGYALSLLAFSAVSVIGLYLLQRLQGSLPLNPTDVVAVPPALAFNTAASFTTNTNWQNYGGEATMSHLTQMAGLTVQNFVSAAVGIAVAVALVRGFVRRRSDTIGNFWADLTRTTTRVLLPLSIVFALVLASQGAIQSLRGPATATTVEGATQSIYRGPVASQEAIKEIGTNGGGIVNANSAHPFENPNAFTDILEILALLSIPFALTYAFGRLVGNQRQGWALFGAMFVLWIASAGLAMHFETDGNPKLAEAGVSQELGNMEGKEVRFGSAAGGLFAASTTGTSTGAVNAAHDSFTPLGGAVPLVNMMLGEVSPGGVGAGPLRDADLRPALGLHRRLDGGENARVPRQEDPGDGDEARHPLHPHRPDADPRFLGDLRADRPRNGVDPQPGRAWPLRGRLRLHFDLEQQRLGLRRADR